TRSKRDWSSDVCSSDLLRELATRARVSPAYLSRVERGMVPASDALIRRAAHAIGTDAEELLLLAGRVPPGWRGVIANYPAKATRSEERRVGKEWRNGGR